MGWGIRGVQWLFVIVGVFPNWAEARTCQTEISKVSTTAPSTKTLDPEQIKRVVAAVRSTFAELRHDKNVLPPRWRRENLESDVLSVGFCFAATNAVYFMLGGKKAGLTPMVASYTDDSGQRSTHWWLRTSSGDFIDPTADQYTAFGEKPPYEMGKGCGFCKSNDSPTRAGSKIILMAQKKLRAEGFRKNGSPF